MRFPEFKEEWKECKVNDYGEVITGNTPSTKDSVNYENGTFLWVSPADLGNFKYVKDTQTKLSLIGFERTRKLPAESILVTCVGSTIGKMGMAATQISTNQQINSIVVHSQYNKHFVYYALQSRFKKYLSSITIQAVPIISKSTFEHLKNYSTNIEEQQKIADLFNLLDERIETQSKIIEDLKTLINGVRSYIFTHQNNCSKHSLGDFLTEYSERNREKQLPSVAVGKYGIRKREEIYSKELSNDYSNNKIIYKDTLTIGMGSSQIDIGILLDDVEYCVSPAYTTYKIHDINSAYLQEYLKLINPILSFKYMITSVRQGKSVNKEELMQHKIFICSSIEQKAIEQKFSAFYKKLEIEQNLLNALVSQKKYLLQQMFI